MSKENKDGQTEKAQRSCLANHIDSQLPGAQDVDASTCIGVCRVAGLYPNDVDL